jgi:hypothetical protein
VATGAGAKKCLAKQTVAWQQNNKERTQMEKEIKKLAESSDSGYAESWWAIPDEYDPAYKVSK